MLSAIVRLSVRHWGVVIALALLLVSYGAYSLLTASLDIFPEFSPKLVIIQTEAPGLSTEEVELRVTQPIEQALGGTRELIYLRSQSIHGLSVVNLTFQESTDLFRARQLVSERLAALAAQMPPGVEAPKLVPLTSSSSTVMTIGFTSDALSLRALRTLVDWTVKPRLLSVSGVADVNVFGGDVREIQIQVRPDRLRKYNVSFQEIAASVRDATDLPGVGFIQTTNQHIALRASNQVRNAEDLGAIVVRHREDGALRIRDVAHVTDGESPPIGKATILGKPGIVVMVIGQYQVGTLTVSDAIDAALLEFGDLFTGQGVELHADLFRPANYIKTSLGNITDHLLIGGVAVVAVLLLILFNMRSAFISATAIPLSLIAAATVLIEAGVSLNIMVIGGLAIALGEVVDDAIIDTENIFRRLRENARLPEPRPVSRVVYDASMEVRGSVVYASFIVVLAFVPLLTLGGVAGRMFAPLGTAYILAILASLAVALTVTPALCTMLLARGRLVTRDPPAVRFLRPGYGRTLAFTARHPGLVIGSVMIVCALGIAALPYLGGRFLPELREGHYMIHTSGVPGTSLEETIRIGTRITKAVMEIPGVRSMSQWAGRAERGADTYGSHYAEYEVDLDPLSGAEQQRVLEAIRETLEGFPGIASEVNTFLIERVDETISGYTAPVVVNIFGRDLDQLDRSALEVADVMRSLSGATDVQVRAPPGTPLLDIRARLDTLAWHGVRPADIVGTARLAYGGLEVGRLYEGDRAVPVTVVLPPDIRGRPEALARLPVRTGNGSLVPLDRLADIRLQSGRYMILHEDGQRLQTVTGNVTGRDLDSFVSALRERLAERVDLPPDSYLELTGSAVAQAESRRELIIHSLLAGVGVLVLLVIALGTLRNMLLVLLNLPFSLVGGVAAALLTGGVLSVGSLVGFVTLFGITLRNSIMLVSHYRHLVENEGMTWNLETAIRGAQERMPSILITGLVTALAMLPIAVDSDNPGREIMGPMASIIIGGLISSTLLNLLVLPSIVARLGRFDPLN